MKTNRFLPGKIMLAAVLAGVLALSVPMSALAVVASEGEGQAVAAVDGDSVQGQDEAAAEPQASEQLATEGPENSWRYVDGELMGDSPVSMFSRAASPQVTWTKKNGVYTFSNGLKVDDAIAIGIDVSYHNGTINWAKVKNAGVDFAIIRCGYGQNMSSQDDVKFLENVKGCQENDIPFGVYLYSYAYTKTMAQGEAKHVLRLLGEANLDPGDLAYPVYYDLEEQAGTDEPCVSDDNGKKHYISNTTLANMGTAFCVAIENAGYTAGVYANTNWWNNFLTSSKFNNWDRWVAQYNNEGCAYEGDYSIWQLTSSGKLSGISGRFDLNLQYKPFETGRFVTTAQGKRFLKYDGTYAKKEWVEYQGKRYYLNAEGYTLTGRWTLADGKTYCFKSDGSPRTGWVSWVNGSRSYFLPSRGGSGAKGWWTIGGKRYYFDAQTSKTYRYSKWIGGSLYYFNKDGSVYTGWCTWNSDSLRTYFLPSKKGAAAKGWWTIGGKRYHFGTDTCRTHRGRWVISGKVYYFNKNGTVHTGWVTWNSDKSRSYFLPSKKGAAAKGWWTIGGKRYYFDKQTGRTYYGKKVVGGKTYYFQRDGHSYKGWVRWNSDGKWSYFNSRGTMCFGRWTIDGKRYNFDNSGKVRSR